VAGAVVVGDGRNSWRAAYRASPLAKKTTSAAARAFLRALSLALAAAALCGLAKRFKAYRLYGLLPAAYYSLARNIITIMRIAL